MVKKKLFLAVALTALSSIAQASDFPVAYTTKESCQSQGPVEICRGYQPVYGQTVLDIYYTGNLLGAPGLSAWVRINYKTDSPQMTFPMSTLTAYGRAMTNHVRITGGCLEARAGSCKVPGTPEMKDFLVWTQTEDGTLNELSLNIAFFDQHGNWDNHRTAGGSWFFKFNQD
jgi:hypothetical protein